MRIRDDHGAKGGEIMASNFRNSAHRNSDNLYLKLMGGFDGSSVLQLLNVLKENSNGTSRVIIHTSCLKDIHTFGLNVFQNNLAVKSGKSVPLVFTGEHANLLAPEGSKSW
jgi:hypothetical protein